jgi:hypothetical protein
MQIGLGQRTQTLIERITAARAARLDEITAARMAELDAANMPADLDTLLARLTAARAANLDNLDALISSRSSHGPADIWTQATRTLTNPATASDLNNMQVGISGTAGGRAAKLDNLDVLVSSRSSHSPTDVRQSVCSPTDPVDSIGRLMYDRVRGYLDAAVSSRSSHGPADIWTQATRTLTNPAAAQDLANMQVAISPTAGGRAAALDEITAARMAELDAVNVPADIDTLLARLTATRAGYLDNLIGTQTAGTYSHPSGTTESDAVVITPAELGKYEKLVLDMSNLTQTTTVRTYVQVDGVNYRLIDAAEYPTDFPTNAKGVVIELTPSNRTQKVTLQSAVAEGVARDVPYFYVVRSLA